ncbi:unnamed protein product, partial [Symbiodinium sp. KB8]
MSASAGMDSSAALSSGQPESPTEMPVPTDVPSPTTPCEDEGETVTVPTAVPTAYTPTRTAPEATVPTAETLTRTFVEVEPTADPTPTQSRTVPRTTARTSTRTATLTAPTVPRVTLRPRVAREAPTAEPPMEEAGMSTQPCSSSSGAVADVAGGGLALFSFVEPLSAKKGPVRDEADEVPLGPPIAGRLEGRFKFAGVFANRSVAAREAMRSRCGACAAGGVIPSQVVQDFLPVLQDVVQVIPESEVPPPMQVLRQPRSPTAPQVSSPPVEDDAEVEVPERPVPSLQETSPADLPVPEDEVASAPPMES